MKIPFDYEKYCTGKYDVQTTSGKSVIGLTKFDTTDDLCLYAVVQTSVESWTITGRWNGYSNASSANDLILIEKVKKIYKNVYKTIYENGVERYYLAGPSYESHAEAVKNAGQLNSPRYIQTVEIID